MQFPGVVKSLMRLVDEPPDFYRLGGIMVAQVISSAVLSRIFFMANFMGNIAMVRQKCNKMMKSGLSPLADGGEPCD